MARNPEYTAGIVHHGADPGLAECLASLRAQSHAPSQIVVVVHDGESESLAALRQANEGVEWVFAANRGYAGGANRVIARSREIRPDAEFVLILNSDVELDPQFSRCVIHEMQTRPEVALASGKLLRPGRALIDSAGITMRRSRRFLDRGSEEPDDGRYAMTEPVFAVSGAAMMLRRAILPILSIEGEVFDEDFFVYHEDTDLAWRARRLGFGSLYVPAASAIHVRGWRQGGRRGVATNIRRHSFKNRYLEMIKNERLPDLLRDLPFVLAAEAARLGFALIMDRAVLGGYWDAAALARRAWRKRLVIERNVKVGAGRGLVSESAFGTKGS